MAGDHDGRLAGSDLVEVRDPGGAHLRGRYVGRPDVDTGEDHDAAENGLERGRPQIATVGQAFRGDDFDSLAVDRQGRTVKCLGQNDVRKRLRAVLVELGPPNGELLLDAALDRLDRRGGGDG